MNFLAHCLLSFNSEPLLLGNFIADDIKGKKYLEYPLEIQHGIMLHRAIDTFTDAHAMVRETKILFRPIFDKFSGPLVDIFYDHLLAENWSTYSSIPLREFTNWAYDSLIKQVDILPSDSRYFLSYVKKFDILYAYKDKKAILKVLEGMTERYNSPYALKTAYPIFEANRGAIEQHFQVFMPEMMEHARLKTLEFDK